MKKVILVSTVLGLGALGMACGEAANNTTNKPANIAPAASPVMSPVVVASPSTNMANSNMKPTTGAPGNMKPANSTMTNTANKK